MPSYADLKIRIDPDSANAEKTIDQIRRLKEEYKRLQAVKEKYERTSSGAFRAVTSRRTQEIIRQLKAVEQIEQVQKLSTREIHHSFQEWEQATTALKRYDNVLNSAVAKQHELNRLRRQGLSPFGNPMAGRSHYAETSAVRQLRQELQLSDQLQTFNRQTADYQRRREQHGRLIINQKEREARLAREIAQNEAKYGKLWRVRQAIEKQWPAKARPPASPSSYNYDNPPLPWDNVKPNPEVIARNERATKQDAERRRRAQMGDGGRLDWNTLEWIDEQKTGRPSTGAHRPHRETFNNAASGIKEVNEALGPGQKLMRGWVGAWTVLASGTAASLFVFQELAQALRMIITNALEMEQAMIGAKTSTNLTAEKLNSLQSIMANMRNQWNDDVGAIKDRFIELEAQGMNTVEILEQINHELSYGHTAQEGTLTGSVNNLAGALKELNQLTFDAFSDNVVSVVKDLADVVRSLNGMMKTFAEINVEDNPILGPLKNMGQASAGFLKNILTGTLWRKQIAGVGDLASSFGRTVYQNISNPHDGRLNYWEQAQLQALIKNPGPNPEADASWMRHLRENVYGYPEGSYTSHWETRPSKMVMFPKANEYPFQDLPNDWKKSRSPGEQDDIKQLLYALQSSTVRGTVGREQSIWNSVPKAYGMESGKFWTQLAAGVISENPEVVRDMAMTVRGDPDEYRAMQQAAAILKAKESPSEYEFFGPKTPAWHKDRSKLEIADIQSMINAAGRTAKPASGVSLYTADMPGITLDAETIKEEQKKVRQAWEDYYDAIGSLSADHYQIEYQEIQNWAIKASEVLDQYYVDQVTKEKEYQLNKQAILAGGTFGQGLQLGVAQIHKDIPSGGQRGYDFMVDVADGIRDDFAYTFRALMDEALFGFDELFTNIAKQFQASITSAIANAAANMVVDAGMGMMGDLLGTGASLLGIGGSSAAGGAALVGSGTSAAAGMVSDGLAAAAATNSGLMAGISAAAPYVGVGLMAASLLGGSDLLGGGGGAGWGFNLAGQSPRFGFGGIPQFGSAGSELPGSAGAGPTGDIVTQFNTAIADMASQFYVSSMNMAYSLPQSLSSSFKAALGNMDVRLDGADFAFTEESVAELMQANLDRISVAMFQQIQPAMVAAINSSVGGKLQAGHSLFTSSPTTASGVSNYMQTAEQVVTAWDSINSAIEKMLSPMNELESKLSGINEQFQGWAMQLVELGFSQEALMEIEGKRIAVIQSTVHEYVQNAFSPLQSIMDAITYGNDGSRFLDEFLQKKESAESAHGLSYGSYTEMVDLLQEWYTTTSAMVTEMESLVKSIDDIIRSIKYSSLNVKLPIEKFQEARKDYNQLRRTAFSTMNPDDINEFTGFASTYLQQAQNEYKSSPKYQEIYEGVMNDLERMRQSAESWNEKIYGSVSSLDDQFMEYATWLKEHQAVVEATETERWAAEGELLAEGFESLLEAQNSTTEAIINKEFTAVTNVYEGNNPYHPSHPSYERWGTQNERHAAGGIFSTPHIGIVAEAGPEAIIPLSNGTVPVKFTGGSKQNLTVIVEIDGEKVSVRDIQAAAEITRIKAARRPGLEKVAIR
jgi:uncharacterized protein YqgV (UPF0045/DUF77 family)